MPSLVQLTPTHHLNQTCSGCLDPISAQTHTSWHHPWDPPANPGKREPRGHWFCAFLSVSLFNKEKVYLTKQGPRVETAQNVGRPKPGNTRFHSKRQKCAKITKEDFLLWNLGCLIMLAEPMDEYLSQLINR